ncbi:MAG: RNA polymerase sigma factor [Phycisphaerae bacterium]
MEPRQLRAAIASARQNSAEGYRALLEAYGPRLYGYFYRATGDHHDAEDLVGEVMLRLVRELKRYDERGRFEPWLFRVAANALRDRIRRRRSRPAGQSLSAGADSDWASNLPDDGPDPDAPAEAEEASEQLNRAMDRLDETTRQMILLRHFGQLSFREVAELTGQPLGTVLARVHRGIRQLRRIMGADDGTE